MNDRVIYSPYICKICILKGTDCIVFLEIRIMWYNEDDFESLDREYSEEISWKIMNRISAEDLENGPIAYDVITGRPIYEHGGCYDPGYDD